MRVFGGREIEPSVKREFLLDAAERAFCRFGYARTTMGSIADEAGVTRPTVYAYFASKDDVFKALADRVRDEILTIQKNAEGLHPKELIRSTLDSYLQSLIAHFGVLAVMAHEAIADPELRTLRDEIFDSSNRRNARYLEKLKEQGLVDLISSPTSVAEAITGIAVRFAEIGSTEPRRRKQLSKDLYEFYLGLVRFRDGIQLARAPHVAEGKPA